MNQKRPAQPFQGRYVKPDTIQVPAATDETVANTLDAQPVEQVVEETVPQVEVEAVAEPQIETPVALTPPPVELSGSAARIEALRSRLNAFAEAYPVNKAMTQSDVNAMVRHMETSINVLLSSTSASEASAMLSLFRNTLHENKGNAFSNERILGRFIEPRSGRLVVSNERTMNIMALLYITANPTTFKAQKGRIDVSASVKGLQSDIAAFIIEYFS